MAKLNSQKQKKYAFTNKFGRIDPTDEMFFEQVRSFVGREPDEGEAESGGEAASSKATKSSKEHRRKRKGSFDRITFDRITFD